MSDLFLIASRKKFRFPSVAGGLTVEQLWDLPLKTVSSSSPSLNTIAIAINRQISELGTESFVDEGNNPAKLDLEQKLEIVKFIIATIQDEAKKAEEAEANRSKNNRIREILAKKKDAELEDMSVEELEKLLVS